MVSSQSAWLLPHDNCPNKTREDTFDVLVSTEKARLVLLRLLLARASFNLHNCTSPNQFLRGL